MSFKDLPEDELLDDLELFEQWAPLLRKLGTPDQLNFHEVSNFLHEKAAPLAVLEMFRLMMTSKSEKVKGAMAKEVAYMGGFKPVERTQNVNVNLMGRQERQAMLRSYLEDVGVEYVPEFTEQEATGEKLIPSPGGNPSQDADRTARDGEVPEALEL